jgi:hypothetical protein
MTRGYLVLAQGNYVEQAEALARSIKQTQTVVNKISIITDGDPDTDLFDHVIKLELDISGDSTWKIHNRVQFYDLTPYDETVILDADMLFLTDVSHWWTHMSTYELLLTSQVLTYSGEIVQSSPYRQTFVDNQLPNVYSAFAYFKKNDFSKVFFDLLKSIIVNWNAWIEQHAPLTPQTFPSLDLAMALAVKILDCEAAVTSKRNYPAFIHMKSGCQGWQTYSEDWTKELNVFTRNGKLLLGNHVQSGVLHYVMKDFVSKELLKELYENHLL